MKKQKKFSFKKYADMCETHEVSGNDGVVVTVRDHIPYEQKVQMAKEIIEEHLMIHDDSCCYENFEIHAAKIHAVLKYYTDVNVDGASIYEAADFAINDGLWSGIMDVIHDDYYQAEDVFITLMDGVVDTFRDDKSLTKAIRTSFGFMFNGEDLTESLAKAEITKDTMFRAINALDEREKAAREKLNAGKMQVGSNIISFAKKE
jgi:hypothetical protein